MGFKARRAGAGAVDPMSISQMAEALRVYALSFPGTHEAHPWGECVVKVRGKVFVFLGREPDGRSAGFSVKLPRSADAVLALPFVEPTGYGLGRSGWVSVTYGPREPLELLQSWIEESYRAIAPKRLLAELDARAS